MNHKRAEALKVRMKEDTGMFGMDPKWTPGMQVVTITRRDESVVYVARTCPTCRNQFYSCISDQRWCSDRCKWTTTNHVKEV